MGAGFNQCALHTRTGSKPIETLVQCKRVDNFLLLDAFPSWTGDKLGCYIRSMFGGKEGEQEREREAKHDFEIKYTRVSKQG